MREEDKKYMPLTWQLRQELAELINPDAASKIEELIKAVIEEDRYNRSPDREYD